MTDGKQLRRDKDRGMIGGVCAGLAEYFSLDPTLVRVAYVVISVITAFAGVLVYIVLWVVIPAKGASEPPPLGAPQQR